MIEIIGSEEQLARVRPEWDALYEKSANATVFQSYDYTYISWEALFKPERKARLYIIIYRGNDARVSAIFPFYLDRRSRLRFINDTNTDFCDGLIDASAKAPYDIIEDVSQHIAKSKEIKKILLDNLSDSSPLLSYMKIFLKNAFLFSSNEFSYLPCRKSENILAELAHLDLKKRKNLIRINQKSRIADLVIIHRSEHAFPEEHLRFLRTEMIKKKMRKADFMDDRFMSMVRRYFEAGIIEIPMLLVAKEPISMGIIFIDRSKSTFIRWIILYKEKQHNLWNNLRYMVDKSREKDITINFARGAYDYKIGNFKPVVKNLYRLTYAKSLFGQIGIIIHVALYQARKIVKKLIRKNSGQ